MLSLLFTLFTGWYLYHFTEYFFHRLGHYSHKYNYIYYLHRKHHIEYPITRLLSPEYISKGEGLLAFIPPTLLLFCILYYLFSFITFFILSAEFCSLALCSDIIHTQIHTENSPLEKFSWFRESRRLHFIHHRRIVKNFSFGGLSHRGDKMFSTYEGPPVLGGPNYIN